MSFNKKKNNNNNNNSPRNDIHRRIFDRQNNDDIWIEFASS